MRVGSKVVPAHLRCEYRLDPMGIDVVSPRLSWRIEAAGRGVRQTAYRILVASSPERLAAGDGDLWDTGLVESGEGTQIPYQGSPLAPRTRCHWKVQLLDGAGVRSEWSDPALWSMGLLAPDDWVAHWIGVHDPTAAADDAVPPDSQLARPRSLRKRFEVSAEVRRATVYVTVLGLYELSLNGQRVGDQILAPEWTNYRKRVQYQTFDVTALLIKGDNNLSADLGNGWYCGNWQHWAPHLRRIYGEQPSLLLQLELEDRDGNITRICSDDSWQGTTDGPRQFAGIYEGETYDARIDADTSGLWRPVTVLRPEVGRLVWQRSEPIRVTEERAPVSISEPTPGTYVFDFGQNVVGRCRLNIREQAGVVVTLRHNEMLNPDGTLYLDNLHAGHLSGGDRQVVRYTCRGRGGEGEERFEPAFTYQGFRYVEVTGLTQTPGLRLLTACVFHTAFAPAGSFTCSNPLVNRLAQNIQWSQRGNFMGVPTDCPQRDERCGYTGDANFFVSTAVYNFDVAAFFSKWLVDVCQDSQRSDGGFADHAPDYGMGGSKNVGWSDAGIMCPYQMYRTYGDLRVISDHYDAMKRNLQMLETTSHGDIRGPDHVGNGDWLNLGGGASKEVIGTAHFAHCFQLMSEMAHAIGHDDDAAKFARRAKAISAAFGQRLIGADGRIKDSSQTGYALAFSMGLVPPDRYEQVRQRFAEEITRFGGHLATGFIGTPRLLPALHLARRDDLAVRLLLEESSPSWLYPVVQGATTIWERWDGWTPAGFADPTMNSFNHYAFGAVGEYLFRYLAGISELEPGYRRIRIAPVLGDGLSWCNASYDSIQGLIRSKWSREPGRLVMDVTIPPNTTAVVHLPAADISAVRENDTALDASTDVVIVKQSPAGIVVQIGSGDYRFTVLPPFIAAP